MDFLTDWKFWAWLVTAVSASFGLLVNFLVSKKIKDNHLEHIAADIKEVMKDQKELSKDITEMKVDISYLKGKQKKR